MPALATQVPIEEFSIKDLKVGRDWGFLSLKQRHEELRRRGTRYSGFYPPVAYFQTYSAEYDKNKTIYTETIRLLDFEEAMKIEKGTLREKISLAMGGDAAVSCTCPAFLYWGFSYILTQLGASDNDAENRFPHIRNPRLRSTVCKHLSLVLEVAPFLATDILRDAKKKGWK